MIYLHERWKMAIHSRGNGLENMGVSKNNGKTPQIIHLFIGFSTIIFTIHFVVVKKSPYFWFNIQKTRPIRRIWVLEALGHGMGESTGPV